MPFGRLRLTRPRRPRRPRKPRGPRPTQGPKGAAKAEDSNYVLTTQQLECHQAKLRDGNDNGDDGDGDDDDDNNDVDNDVVPPYRSSYETYSFAGVKHLMTIIHK